MGSLTILAFFNSQLSPRSHPQCHGSPNPSPTLSNSTTTKTTTKTTTDRNPNSNPSAEDSTSPSSDPCCGVKGDLSELTKTLSRQFWGVASFLAPPPDPPSPKQGEPSDPDLSEEDVIAGIWSDFAEIGGRFKSGISKLSSNINVSEFTKIASNLLQIGSEEEAEEAGLALGVSPEVLAFVRYVSMHPETWLDFPLSDDEDSDGMI